MSEINQLIALREVAKLHVKQWQEKAWAQSHGALFHEDPSCRPKCLEHANLYQGRMMEAEFWRKQIQSSIDDEGEKMSTTVDKQAEATAAAVVLGEEKCHGTWFQCPVCRTKYDQYEANGRGRRCCGCGMHICQGEDKQ